MFVSGPLCGGLLQMMLLLLEEANLTDSFLQKRISHTNCQRKGKKQYKKLATDEKMFFFPGSLRNISGRPETLHNKSGQAQNVS